MSSSSPDVFIFTPDDTFARDMEVLYHFEETLYKLDLSDSVTDRRPFTENNHFLFEFVE